MKKLVHIYLLVLLFPAALSGQGLLFGFQSGMATFGMEDLRRYNEFIVGYTELDAVAVHDYPPWFYYRAKVAADWQKVYLEASYTWTFTGARYSIYDYSGEYLYDTKISGKTPMLGFGFYLNRGPALRVSVSNNVGRIATAILMEESLEIPAVINYDESIELEARNYCWEPGIRLSWHQSFFRLTGYLGYHIQFTGDGIYPLENPDYHIKPGYAVAPIEPGWKGIRAGIGFDFFLAYDELKK